MGYLLNTNIANITEPKQISLVRNPNFIELKKKAASADKLVECSLIITRQGNETTDTNISFTIKETKNDSSSKTFTSTAERSKVDDNTFLISNDVRILAENIRACLMKHAFFKHNFYLTIPYNESDKNTCRIDFKSRGAGDRYCFESKDVKSNSNYFIYFEGDSNTSTSNDSMMLGDDSCSYDLDFYINTGVFPGENDAPEPNKMGKYLTSLTKAYFDSKIWFDLNSLMSKKVTYSNEFLSKMGWCNSGTLSDYRFVLKRTDGVENQVFYYSDVLYVLNGYGATLESGDAESLNGYNRVFDLQQRTSFCPLTNRLELNHVKGQKQYFNFLLKDTFHSVSAAGDAQIGLLYKYYSQSGRFIQQTLVSQKSSRLFNAANVIELNLDSYIQSSESQTGRTVGRVEVYLACDGVEASLPLIYRILPKELHSVNDFAFLNRLGGWDSFNFEDRESVEYKTTASTYYKTTLPGFSISDSIEAVAQKNVTEQFVVKTPPVSRAVAEWLKELSASIAVYELSTKRYIVIDEFTLKYNSVDDLFQPEMKYHYSDSTKSST